MPEIRPVSDLRNNFTDISKIVHERSEPIFFDEEWARRYGSDEYRNV